MYRVVFPCTLFLLIAIISIPAYSHPEIEARSPVEWMKGYTIVLVDARSKSELADARDFIIAQGGTVAVVLPPHAILGWITPEVSSKIVGRHGIRSVHRSVVDAKSTGFTDRDTLIAINMFNDVASGRSARRISRDAKRKAGPDKGRPGMVECAEPRPQINRDDFVRNLRLLGAEQSAKGFQTQFMANSDAMNGTVAVALFLMESNGGIDPNLYTWSQEDQSFAIAQVLDGLNWWVDQSRAFGLAKPLQFTLVPYLPNDPACQIPYEPIIHPGSDANLWIGRVMSNLGTNQGDVASRGGAFDQTLKDQYHTDWAYSIFMVYNPAPAPAAYTDGRASWAYIGGPHTSILFRSFGWQLARIVSHETGHIFYACDEYFQPGYAVCNCRCAPEVRPEALNGNCQDASCTANSTECMMRLNEFALCAHTVAQIGWTAVVPKPIPTAPQGLVATASSPTQVNLLWQDTSNVEDGFLIERRGGSSAEFSQVAVVTANATTYSDASALANTAYAYRLRAFNSTGTSSFTAEASVVTPSVAPTLSVGTSDMTEATVGVPYSRTLVANGGKPDYIWSLQSGSLPPGLSLSQSGTISGTPTSAGTNNFVARVTDSLSSSATRALSLVVKPAAPLTITTAQLPRGSVDTTYSQQIGSSGGQTPYNWSRESGNLPEGLTLNQSTGFISGTPERAGTSSFIIKLTDATGASITSTLSIIINPATNVLAFETLSLPDGVVGEDYSETLTAAGGSSPYRWTIASGKLPDGLQMTEAGVISGKPTTPGEEISFELRLSDQSGQTLTKTFSIDIDPAPQLTILSQNPLPLAAVGVPYRNDLKATSGSAPYEWDKKKNKKFGKYPEGITLSPDGVLSGTPTTQGVSNFTVRVVDSRGKKATKPLSIEVGPPPPPLEIKTQSLPSGTQSLLYNSKLEAAGGIGPYSWTLESGVLPDGLALSADGSITGRANQAGTASFTVRVKDSLGTSSVRTFFITVVLPPPPLVIQTIQLPETSAERSYSQTLQASGGVPPYTWSIASGSLGQGLNLSADGVISGTPALPGTSVFVVRVTDSAQQSVTRTLAILIKPADKLAPFGNLETPDFRVTLNNTATGSGWALDNVGVTTVEIIVDGHKIGEAIYGLNRPDIGAIWGSFPNASRSGFSFAFDTTTLTNGEHTLSVRLLDAAGNATVVGTRPIVTQNSVLSITTSALIRGRKGEPYSQQFQAVNGKPPYSWTLFSGSLPAGISLNASGLMAGTPSVFGNFTFGIRVTDSSNVSAIASYVLTVLPDVDPLRVLSSGEQAPGQTGVNYSQQLFFLGGRPPVQWSIASGSLPPGLSLNSLTGVISGRPVSAGTFTFTARVTDSESTSAVSNPISILITLGPLGVINTGDLTPGQTGVNYSQPLLGTGGTVPYTWSMNSGSLPPGLTINANTGTISGKPTIPGSYPFVLRITDSTSAFALSDTLKINVTAGLLTVTSTGDLTAGQVNVDYTHQLLLNGGSPPYVWNLNGALPAGLTLNAATGVISGKPTASGTFTFTVSVKDSLNIIATSGQLRIIISP
ncbi:MAG TPA: putative Ig domain-containing protein [Blastocatellia bacterium]|nr:putative Ig domain-containing protein [Blastocatellia bacterium]